MYSTIVCYVKKTINFFSYKWVHLNLLISLLFQTSKVRSKQTGVPAGGRVAIVPVNVE